MRKVVLSMLVLLISGATFSVRAQSSTPTPVCMDINGTGQSCMYFETYTPRAETSTPTVTETSTPTVTPAPSHYTELQWLDIKLDSSNPTTGPISGAEWRFPGSATTGSCKILHLNYLTVTPTIEFAMWRVVWNPNSSDDSPAGVRLISADPGPSNITEIAVITRNHTVTPVNTPMDVTAQIQALYQLRTEKILCIQAFGTGVRAPDIFMATVELVVQK